MPLVFADQPLTEELKRTFKTVLNRDFLSPCFHAENSSYVENINVKEWQDGLRALLPNININFGGLPNSSSSSLSSSSSSSSINHTGAPGVSGSVSHSLCWDSTASWMDPAIIRGRSHKHHLQTLHCSKIT